MVVVLPRTPAAVYKMEPLQWLPVTRESSGLPPTASVTCENRHEGLISDHAIAEDGTVSPSVVCTQEGCGWHEYIRLEGWGE